MRKRQLPGSARIPVPERMSIRLARERFGALADRVAAGARILICRRSTPLAVLLPVGDFERVLEANRREEELAAILRGRGFDVEPWTTPGVLEAVSRLAESSRR